MGIGWVLTAEVCRKEEHADDLGFLVPILTPSISQLQAAPWSEFRLTIPREFPFWRWKAKPHWQQLAGVGSPEPLGWWAFPLLRHEHVGFYWRDNWWTSEKIFFKKPCYVHRQLSLPFLNCNETAFCLILSLPSNLSSWSHSYLYILKMLRAHSILMEGLYAYFLITHSSDFLPVCIPAVTCRF